MKIWREIVMPICIILLSISIIILGGKTRAQKQRINNLENEINYILWEREYLDWAINDSLKQ